MPLYLNSAPIFSGIEEVNLRLFFLGKKVLPTPPWEELGGDRKRHVRKKSRPKNWGNAVFPL